MNMEEVFKTIIKRKYHYFENKLSKYNLVQGQADLLTIIKDNSGSNQKELADILNIKSSSLSVRLDKLEKMGYIYKEIDGEDRKKFKIFITPDGKNASIQSKRVVKEYNEKLYNGFSKNDKKQFEKYLLKIEKNLKRIS